MPVMVHRLTPATLERVVHAQPYALVRVERDRSQGFHDGVADYFAAAYPGRFGFGTLARRRLTDPTWLDRTFVSAVGQVRGGVPDGYFLFGETLVVGHHSGQVRSGVQYGDPEELAAQRDRVHQLGFSGRRVAPETLEIARAIVVYFDAIVSRRERAAGDSGAQYTYEKRSPPTRPPPAPAGPDPYRVLGIERSATDAEVKSAFRQGLKMNHPDKVAHLSEALQKFAETQTLEIKAAYEQILAERGKS